MASRTSPPKPTPTMSLRDIPISLYVGLGIALLGFVVSFSSSSTSTVGGEMVSCSYTDFGGFIAAALCLMCAYSGLHKRQSEPFKYPVHWGIAYGIVAVLGVFAVIHVLRGLGIIGGIC